MIKIDAHNITETNKHLMDTVLIVDDNPYICNMLTDFCSFVNRQAITAEDGFEAIRLFRQHQHQISLVILDMTLPDMNGTQVLWAIRQVNPEIKVIVSSGSSRLMQERPFPDDDITVFLPKPYTIERLTAVFEELT